MEHPSGCPLSCPHTHLREEAVARLAVSPLVVVQALRDEYTAHNAGEREHELSPAALERLMAAGITPEELTNVGPPVGDAEPGSPEHGSYVAVGHTVDAEYRELPSTGALEPPLTGAERQARYRERRANDPGYRARARGASQRYRSRKRG